MSKFSFSISKGKTTSFVSFEGILDEDAKFNGIGLDDKNEVEIDLSKINRVTSKGMRTWLSWVATLDQNKKYAVRACSRVFVNQANLISGLIPKWMSIHSFELPYFCEKCGYSFGMTLKLERNRKAPEDVPEEAKCPKCSADASLDTDPERYFQFLNG